MARSKETYSKKEVQNKKAKKRKEKEKKRLEKKEQGKTTSFDDMIAWVDENGNLSSTPPDPDNKTEIDIDDIAVSVPKSEDREDISARRGKVNNFDVNKGFGFITDSQTRDSIFVHINDCADDLKSGDKVEYEIEKGPKGLKAKNVKLVK